MPTRWFLHPPPQAGADPKATNGPPGYGPQVVQVSMYQGNPFWVHIFDPLPNESQSKPGINNGLPTTMERINKAAAPTCGWDYPFPTSHGLEEGHRPAARGRLVRLVRVLRVRPGFWERRLSSKEPASAVPSFTCWFDGQMRNGMTPRKTISCGFL